MSNTDYDKFAKTLKFEKIESGEKSALVKAFVSAEFLNGVDIAHGGFLFALADYAAAVAANSGDKVCLSCNASINFVNPCPNGVEILASAKTVFENEKGSVCDVEISSLDRGEIYAVYQTRFIAKKR